MEQSRISNEFGETESPSFALIDLGLSFQFTKSIRITIGIQNLFDTLYYEHLSRSVRDNSAAYLRSGPMFFPVFQPGPDVEYESDFLFFVLPV